MRAYPSIDTRLVRVLRAATVTHADFASTLALILDEMSLRPEHVEGVSGVMARRWLRGDAICRAHMRVPILYATIKRHTGEVWKVPHARAMMRAGVVMNNMANPVATLVAGGFSKKKALQLVAGDGSPIDAFAVELIARQREGASLVDRLVSYARLTLASEDDGWWVRHWRRSVARMHVLDAADLLEVEDDVAIAWCHGERLPEKKERAGILLALHLDSVCEPPLFCPNVKRDLAQAIHGMPPHAIAQKMGDDAALIEGALDGYVKVGGRWGAALVLRARAASMGWIDHSTPLWGCHPKNRFASAWRVEKMLMQKYCLTSVEGGAK